jgi:membrane dipeptidase
MVVDVSHLSAASFWDVLAVSLTPPIASHSNCAALAAHPRNLSDAQIRALVRAGGMQSVTYVREFLGGTADRSQVVRHILHHLDVAGTDRHLGLGSDFDGVREPVPGLEDATRLPDLAEALWAAGLEEETITRILGQNYIDFFHRIWA